MTPNLWLFECAEHVEPHFSLWTRASATEADSINTS